MNKQLQSIKKGLAILIERGVITRDMANQMYFACYHNQVNLTNALEYLRKIYKISTLTKATTNAIAFEEIANQGAYAPNKMFLSAFNSVCNSFYAS